MFLTMAVKKAKKNEVAVEGLEKISVARADGKLVEITVFPQKIQTTDGVDVDVADYFYTQEGEKAFAPGYFNSACGYPVLANDRDDLTDIFDKVFNPKDKFVLLKARDKEVYGVLVPLKFSSISYEEDALFQDYQFHAVSFILDGSVNHDRFKSKMKEIATIIGYENK